MEAETIPAEEIEEVGQLTLLRSGAPRIPETIKLLRGDVGEAIELARQAAGGARIVIADPPWPYDNTGTAGKGFNGTAKGHYDTPAMEEILRVLVRAYDAAGSDSYLFLWITWPVLLDFLEAVSVLSAGTGLLVRALLERIEDPEDREAAEGELSAWLRRWIGRGSSPAFPWRYISGGSWHKTGGLGAGFHFRGDSEPFLLFGKGRPMPICLVCKAHLCQCRQLRKAAEKLLEAGGRPEAADLNRRPRRLALSNAIAAPRTQTHSEKPVDFLIGLIEAMSLPGDLVLSVYSGSAPEARAAKVLERRFIGAELDEDKHRLAIALLAGFRK